MGAAASANLTPEQKALISKDVQDKYKLLATDDSKSHEDVIQELTRTFTESALGNSINLDTNVAMSSGTPMSPGKPVPSIHVDSPAIKNTVGGDSLMDSLRASVDDDHHHLNLNTSDEKANATVAMDLENIPTMFDEPKAGRSVSLDTASLKSSNINGMLEDQQKVATFLEELKGGRVQTEESSDFRVRRLTYAQKTKQKPEKAMPLNNSRTTVYASTEIGVKTAEAPFTDEIMGTFSCHGIEPAPYVPPAEGQEEEEDPESVDKTNQDRGCVVYPYNTNQKDALFMVLDGHGEQGDRVSEFVMRNIVNQLEMNLNMKLDVNEALSNAFIHANTALMTTPIKYMTSGTTCCAMYVRGQEYWIANCGDSRAVMAQCSTDDLTKGCPIEELDLKAFDLSRDHKPDDPEEQKRIEEWGGFVKPPPEEGLSARVYLDKNYTMIGLAMARSIGDYAVKAVGVIPTPEITKYEFKSEDKFLILASDGVWEFICSQEAVDIVKANLHRGCTEACQELIQIAAIRWAEEEGDYRDDITAIVLRLPIPIEKENSSVKN